eukprot:TRINITY_DN517_c0_g1_i1.p1 TRINITY_DN517_c0_g1~~TRINITY_DN517_c0_g1_i1.p1  ORF type:complete len:122 (-),score=37.07 TRINITY_DN517_c0_g1_i1:193-558(-)
MIVEADQVIPTEEEIVNFTFSKKRLKVHKVVSSYNTIIPMPILESDIGDDAKFRFYQAWANTRYVLHVDDYVHMNDSTNDKRTKSCFGLFKKKAKGKLLEDEFPLVNYKSNFTFGKGQGPD